MIYFNENHSITTPTTTISKWITIQSRKEGKIQFIRYALSSSSSDIFTSTTPSPFIVCPPSRHFTTSILSIDSQSFLPIPALHFPCLEIPRPSGCCHFPTGEHRIRLRQELHYSSTGYRSWLFPLPPSLFSSQTHLHSTISSRTSHPARFLRSYFFVCRVCRAGSDGCFP